MNIFEVCGEIPVKFNDLKYCIETLKADINIKDIDGETPFGSLCYHSYDNGFNLEMLKYCIETAKADINIKDGEGYTPFSWLCSNSYNNGFNLEMLKYCEIAKADINSTDNIGNTPFYWLCYNNCNGFNLEMLKYCTDIAKADINIFNIYGQTPFYWLCELNYADKPKILNWLNKKNIVSYETLENCAPEIKLRFMPSIKVNPNDKDILIK